MWERRAALTPWQVSEIVGRRKDVEVLVQPCKRRVFSNEEYVAAGAVLETDASKADVLLGVKQPDLSVLSGRQTLCCFSHTHKGQREGEALLEACKLRETRLIDWERVTDDDGKRLVAFGRFAGIAGFHEGLSALGQRLLALGASTPLLGIPSIFAQPSLEAAFETLRSATSGVLLEPPLAPLVVVFTGSGNVSDGAKEAFEKLPNHRYVDSLEDLRSIVSSHETADDGSALFYGFSAKPEDLVRRKSLDKEPQESSYDAAEYRECPELYESMVPETVGPLMTMLVHGAYWSPRCPRLVGLEDLKACPHLLCVSDISCDFSPSSPFFEGLHRPTTPDAPTYILDDRVAVTATDILPAALPREASEHFGRAVAELLDGLLDSTAQSLEDMPTILQRATIVDHGHLAPAYAYLQDVRRARQRSDSSPKDVLLLNKHRVELRLRGHLFDSGLINDILDIVDSLEEETADFSLTDVEVGQKGEAAREPSTATVVIEASDRQILQKLVDQCRAIVDAKHFSAQADLVVVERGLASNVKTPTTRRHERVVVLGAGLVARPLVEDLAAAVDDLTVASESAADLATITSPGVKVRQGKVPEILHEILSSSSSPETTTIVVSLLPPLMHAVVARACVSHGAHLVTASYASGEIRDIAKNAFREKGLLLCAEAGLDPGLDHASAARLIEKARGGDKNNVVESFSSVCGGLVALDLAKQSPLAYRFSWSPRGVFSALDQPARYRRDGLIFEIPDVLSAERAYDGELFGPTYAACLRVLPNRDALPYAEVYGLDASCDIFRGTLRFKGFASAVRGLRRLGYLRGGDTENAFSSDEDLLSAKDVIEALERQGLDEKTIPHNDPEAFADLLGRHFALNPGDRDLVLMRHEVIVRCPSSGQRSRFSSTLELLGDDKGGHTAMATTVGLAAAITARLILRDDIRSDLLEAGTLILPNHPALYPHLLADLADRGIAFHETEEEEAPS